MFFANRQPWLRSYLFYTSLSLVTALPLNTIVHRYSCWCFLLYRLYQLHSTARHLSLSYFFYFPYNTFIFRTTLTHDNWKCSETQRPWACPPFSLYLSLSNPICSQSNIPYFSIWALTASYVMNVMACPGMMRINLGVIPFHNAGVPSSLAMTTQDCTRLLYFYMVWMCVCVSRERIFDDSC